MHQFRIAIAGGGTGGHVTPALATVTMLRELRPTIGDLDFFYIGSKTGIERRMAADAHLHFVPISTGKLRRYFSLQNFTDPFRVSLGILQALRILQQFRPDVLLCTGGFVAVPAAVAAACLRIPVILHEQTEGLGLANRLISRLATQIALSHESSAACLPRTLQERILVVGNPIRPELLRGSACRAKQICKFQETDDSLPAIYITGGAQGAAMINCAIAASLPSLLNYSRVVHQCGAARDERGNAICDALRAIVDKLSPELRRRYYCQPFFGQELPDVLSLCQIVVGRAGAGTVAEITALGKASILIPLAKSAGGEQLRNARRLEVRGAALVFSEEDLTRGRAAAELITLVQNPQRIIAMQDSAKQLGCPGAASALANLVLKVAAAKEKL
jgi:UDP-N-acetylglucosamine--N-acetylmuramyl-(pentapeptide) pyrophosphoryl-undecaprenol N-acetylglucosamine transferase